MVRAEPVRFDIVISDMAMLGITGDELISSIHKSRPDIPTILCTGYSSKIDEKDAARIGVSSFIMKPFELSQIAKMIRRAIDRSKEH